MNFERISRVKFPSKQLNVKNFSSLAAALAHSNSPTNVNPWFFTGLIDAAATPQKRFYKIAAHSIPNKKS